MPKMYTMATADG